MDQMICNNYIQYLNQIQETYSDMKVLEEIKTQVEQQMKIISGKCIEKRYAKITDKLKQQFIEKVINNRETIKSASQELSINYSSAKAIIAEYRRRQPDRLNENQSQSLSHQETRRAHFKEVGDYDWNKFKVEIICDQEQINDYTLKQFATQ